MGDNPYKSNPIQVLVVCDDLEAGGIWAYAIRQRGVTALQARTAAEAMQIWSQEIPDLILIDPSGPDLDAVQLCAELKAESIVPILIFTSHRDEKHILEAYQAGADEVVPKPVSPALFLAKMTAWLKRCWTVPAEALDSLEVGPIRLDPSRRSVWIEDRGSIKLTNLEFRLLQALMSHPGWTFESDRLVERVWGYCGDGDHNLLKNVVYRLRRKVEPDPSQPRYIQTEAGMGYKFSID